MGGAYSMRERFALTPRLRSAAGENSFSLSKGMSQFQAMDQFHRTHEPRRRSAPASGCLVGPTPHSFHS